MTAPAGFVKVGGVWKGITQPSLKVGGVWKDVETAYVKVAGVWKEWFNAAPAAVPDQIVDLQIVGYGVSGTTRTFDLAWTPPAGTPTEYKLEVWKSYGGGTNNVNLFWKGASVNNDGTGGERDYVPSDTVTIAAPASTYTYTQTSYSAGQTGRILFRITAKNATGYAVWASNAPWIRIRNATTDVPLPTPLLTAAMSFSGSATATAATLAWTAATTNVAAWTQSRIAVVGARHQPGTTGSGYVSYRSFASPTITGATNNFALPYGVVAASVAFYNTGPGDFMCGNIHMVPAVGIKRVPYNSASPLPGSSPITLVADINTYDAGAFKDVGFVASGYASNPVTIGSFTPQTFTVTGGIFGFRLVGRTGNASASVWGAQTGSFTLDANTFKCIGYGDENELARYMSGTNVTFVPVDGGGTAQWNWTGGDFPVLGIQDGVTYSVYVN
jgi:hypothetical protein